MLRLKGNTGARYGLMLISLAARNSAKANNAQAHPDSSECETPAHPLTIGNDLDKRCTTWRTGNFRLRSS
jgi:hypothetical protein